MTSELHLSDLALPTYESRGVTLRLFPWIINHGLDRFEQLAGAIDALPRATAEWAKIPLLVNEPSYLDFLCGLTGRPSRDIVGFLNDLRTDLEFASAFAPSLAELDQLPVAGDLRFHSTTLYVIVRSIAPRLMIETGVAHGKSSSFILLGMEHNQSGSLVSIDLPPDGALADGSLTSMHDRATGWLVPDYLRGRWTLHLGDSLDLLPTVLAEIGSPDIFLHDSLHTVEHTEGEFRCILSSTNGPLLLLADNIDMGSGDALADVLANYRTVGHAYRDFGGALISQRS